MDTKWVDGLPEPIAIMMNIIHLIFMSHFPDRSEVVHKAIREYMNNHPITQ